MIDARRMSPAVAPGGNPYVLYLDPLPSEQLPSTEETRKTISCSHCQI